MTNRPRTLFDNFCVLVSRTFVVAVSILIGASMIHLVIKNPIDAACTAAGLVLVMIVYRGLMVQ